MNSRCGRRRSISSSTQRRRLTGAGIGAKRSRGAARGQRGGPRAGADLTGPTRTRSLRSMSNSDMRAEAPLADFVPMLDGRARLLVRRGWEDAAEHLADPDGVTVDEQLPGGREPAVVTTLPGGARIVVRRYRRGGVMRLLNRTHYFGGNRAFD